jgi:hypothetical protein
MLRWFILILTFSVWLASMALVYDNFKPNDDRTNIPGSVEALERIFAEDAELKRCWRVLVDLDKLNAGFENPNPKPDPNQKIWDGVDETSLRDVGFLNTEVVKKQKDATRLEQLTEAQISIPQELKFAPLQMLSGIFYETRLDISLDKGLENFNSTMKMGMGLEVKTFGFREEDGLTLTHQIWQKDKQLMNNVSHMDIGPRAAPSLELLPFQAQPEIKVGKSWEIAMLDTSITVTQDAKPKIRMVKATCTGKKQIMYQNRLMWSFEVESEDGRARAWYSADGVVLKQLYRLFEVLDVMVVRVDPERAPPISRRRRPRN